MRQFNRKHQTIHWYSKGDTWTFNADCIRLQHHKKTEQNYKEGLSGSGHADTPLKPGKVPESWWAEAKENGLAMTAKQKKQYVGYPTQKPIALLRRIIQASSNSDDMILDPFCGCATACIAAELEERQWVGIDISPKAKDLVILRLGKELGYFGGDQFVVHRTDIPSRTDLGKIIQYNDIKNKQYLYGEQGGFCNGCEHHFMMQNFTVDRIIAKAHGGTDHIVICNYCAVPATQSKVLNPMRNCLSCSPTKAGSSARKPPNHTSAWLSCQAPNLESPKWNVGLK